MKIKTVRLLVHAVIFLLILSSCGTGGIGNPAPANFLDDDDADIFVLDDIVYSNVQDVDWVQELDYIIGEEMGEITKQAEKAKDFKNGTANKLPVGTKIFETGSPISIAIVDGEEIPYLEMIEG